MADFCDALEEPYSIDLLIREPAGQTTLEVRDNGTGYPKPILRNLSDTSSDPNAPHILGLHLVQQILTAHGGQADFFNDGGAVAVLRLQVLHHPIS